MFSPFQWATKSHVSPFSFSFSFFLLWEVELDGDLGQALSLVA
jgi:hypothetical protein